MVLARLCAGDWLNVNRPAPARLVGHPADNRIVEIDDIDPTMRNRPHVAWLTESPSLESHRPSRPRLARMIVPQRSLVRDREDFTGGSAACCTWSSTAEDNASFPDRQGTHGHGAELRPTRGQGLPVPLPPDHPA